MVRPSDVKGPGVNDKLEPADLDDVRARVLLPVVTKLIPPSLLQNADVGWGPSLSRERPYIEPGSDRKLWDDENDLFVSISSSGNNLLWQLWQLDYSWHCESLGDAVFALASRTEQWVLEILRLDVSSEIEYIIPSR